MTKPGSSVSAPRLRHLPSKSYGAVGDNSTLNQKSIQMAITAAAAAGGGYVTVPRGVFLTGSVSLASSVYIVLEAGAVLQGSADPQHYNNDWDYWHVVRNPPSNR